jgi:hypothetical protein
MILSAKTRSRKEAMDKEPKLTALLAGMEIAIVVLATLHPAPMAVRDELARRAAVFTNVLPTSLTAEVLMNFAAVIDHHLAQGNHRG